MSAGSPTRTSAPSPLRRSHRHTAPSLTPLAIAARRASADHRRDNLFQGLKLFFDEDTDLMSPSQVLGLRPASTWSSRRLVELVGSWEPSA